MTNSQLHKKYLTMQEAVDILGSTESKKKDIGILPPTHGDVYATDVDKCHKKDFLPNDVPGTLEKRNNDECKVASDVSAVQSKENKPTPKKNKKNAEAVLWKKKSSSKEISEANAMHLADSHLHLALLEPVTPFRLSFNQEICSLIACETERYAP